MTKAKDTMIVLEATPEMSRTDKRDLRAIAHNRNRTTQLADLKTLSSNEREEVLMLMLASAWAESAGFEVENVSPLFGAVPRWCLRIAKGSDGETTLMPDTASWLKWRDRQLVENLKGSRSTQVTWVERLDEHQNATTVRDFAVSLRDLACPLNMVAAAIVGDVDAAMQMSLYVFGQAKNVKRADVDVLSTAEWNERASDMAGQVAFQSDQSVSRLIAALDKYATAEKSLIAAQRSYERATDEKAKAWEKKVAAKAARNQAAHEVHVVAGKYRD